MKAKPIWRSVLESVVFCALLVCLIAGATTLLERKASTNKLKPFLDAPKEYDVLFVGDSHLLNGVYPMEIWQDYGIAGYNLASIGSTLPVTYWSLMNALDYAAPKLVVIGIKDVQMNYKLSGSSADVHTALDAYPLSRNKIRAIYDLTDDPYAVDDEGNLYQDLRWEYIFTLGKYHARWSELMPSDFAPLLNRQKGAEMMISVAAPRPYDIISETLTAEETGWGYAYLRRAIEACQARGIDVMLVHLPYPSTEEDQLAANAVYYIAEEYGVNYVDFVYLDQVVDYRTDCYDHFSHLNPSGARKVTDYIGRYIADHYDVPDRRTDAAYSHWMQEEAAYRAEKLAVLEQHSDEMDSLLMLLHDDDFDVSIAVAEGSARYEDEVFLRLMQNIGRERIYEEDMFTKWSDSLYPLAMLDEAAAGGAAYFAEIDRETGDIAEAVGPGAQEAAALCFGEGTADVRIRITDRQSGEARVYAL